MAEGGMALLSREFNITVHHSQYCHVSFAAIKKQYGIHGCHQKQLVTSSSPSSESPSLGFSAEYLDGLKCFCGLVHDGAAYFCVAGGGLVRALLYRKTRFFLV